MEMQQLKEVLSSESYKDLYLFFCNTNLSESKKEELIKIIINIKNE
jgi:hypothetical protein